MVEHKQKNIKVFNLNNESNLNIYINLIQNIFEVLNKTYRKCMTLNIFYKFTYQHSSKTYLQKFGLTLQ